MKSKEPKLRNVPKYKELNEVCKCKKKCYKYSKGEKLYYECGGITEGSEKRGENSLYSCAKRYAFLEIITFIIEIAIILFVFKYCSRIGGILLTVTFGFFSCNYKSGLFSNHFVRREMRRRARYDKKCAKINAYNEEVMIKLEERDKLKRGITPEYAALLKQGEVLLEETKKFEILFEELLPDASNLLSNIEVFKGKLLEVNQTINVHNYTDSITNNFYYNILPDFMKTLTRYGELVTSERNATYVLDEILNLITSFSDKLPVLKECLCKTENEGIVKSSNKLKALLHEGVFKEGK